LQIFFSESEKLSSDDIFYDTGDPVVAAKDSRYQNVPLDLPLYCMVCGAVVKDN